MIILPSLDMLGAVAAELAIAAHEAEDRANENAINKAALQLHSGCVPVPTTGGFLVESKTRSGLVHRVSNVYGCNCEAGSKGKPCWHMSVLEIIEAAQMRVLPIDRKRAEREMDEVFGVAF